MAQLAKAPPCPPDHAGLQARFENFDSIDVYNQVKHHLSSIRAKNFVVEFSPVRCRIALDLNLGHIKALLSETHKPDGDDTVRWINCWGTKDVDGDEDQEATREAVVDYIGQHYGFSRRLRESMRVWDRKKPHILSYINNEKHRKTQREALWRAAHHRERKHRTQPPAPSAVNADDAEKGLGSNTTSVSSSEHGPAPQPAPQPAPGMPPKDDLERQEDLQNMALIHGSLNYNTIDQVLGKFICIGANWLYQSQKKETGPETHEPSLVPPKHWTWCALCFDPKLATARSGDSCSSGPTPNSVFTFHETPIFEKTDAPASQEDQAYEIRSMRKNTLRVLLQLSKCGNQEYQEKFTQLASVRWTETVDPSTFPSEQDPQVEMASSLFYYLFEDYGPASKILNDSRDILEMLDRRVLTYPQRKDFSRVDDIVPRLHQVSKDLRQLQHLFVSYKKLVDRMLSSATLAPLPPTAEGDPAQARLAASARDRFGRLSDRLELLMLNSIQEYLEENKSLATTYFNLTAQKDSQATSRLTRSATLLAKLSVFFLPINFITSYFSMQVPSLTDVTPTTYWIIFGVTLSLSFLSLFFFSRMLMIVSDTLDEWQRAAAGLLSSKVGWPRNKEVAEVSRPRA